VASEQTLCLIKPDAVIAGNIGHIITLIENNDFTIRKLKMLAMSREIAEKFYSVHKGKHFYDNLVEFMTSSPIVAILLERENAILGFRELAGSTDSRKAAKGTIRCLYGTDNQENAVHGSDSPENFEYEQGVIFES